MKVVEIEEVDHSIHLQFQIILEWKEMRATYLNLKSDTSLNTLPDDDIARRTKLSQLLAETRC